MFGKYELDFSNDPYIPNNVTVADLRLENIEWYTHFITQMFYPFDVKIILAIPTGFLENEDIRWSLTKDGRHTVESGYNFALKYKDIAESSNMEDTCSCWKIFCRLVIPPKVKHFG